MLNRPGRARTVDARTRPAVIGEALSWDAGALPRSAGALRWAAEPGTAYDLKVTLKPDGTIEMTWKADNPPGCNRVIWQLYRKVELTGEYAYIGGCGSRKYVDTTVPAGVPTVIYRIMGTRSTSVGDAAEFVVNFGVAGTPPVVTAATAATSAKAAPIAA